MKTRFYRPPQGDQFLTVRASFVTICEGDVCAGVILAFLLSWHDYRLNACEMNAQANDIAERGGDRRTQSESPTQFHTNDQLVRGLIGLYKKKSITAGIQKLEGLGFITVTRNPNPRYAFDKTRFFIINEEAINKRFERCFPGGNAPSSEQSPSSVEKSRRSVPGEPAIEEDHLEGDLEDSEEEYIAGKTRRVEEIDPDAEPEDIEEFPSLEAPYSPPPPSFVGPPSSKITREATHGAPGRVLMGDPGDDGAPPVKTPPRANGHPKARDRSPIQQENDRLLLCLASLEAGQQVETATKKEFVRHAVALSDIRTACPKVNESDLRFRAENYRTHFGGQRLTSTALAKFWTKCVKPAPPEKKPWERHRLTPNEQIEREFDVIARTGKF